MGDIRKTSKLFGLGLLLLLFSMASLAKTEDHTEKVLVKKLTRLAPAELKTSHFEEAVIPAAPVYSAPSTYLPPLERSFGEEPAPQTFLDLPQDPLHAKGLDLSHSDLPADTINALIAKAKKLENFIEEGHRTVDYLKENMALTLPVGIVKHIGQMTYSVIFYKMKISPTKAYVDAFLIISGIPQMDQPLVFMGRDIAFSRDGGISGVGKVELMGDYDIPFAQKKIILQLNGGDLKNPEAEGGTYASFDCYGFKELSLDVGVKFSKDLMQTVDANGKGTGQRVTANFKANITDWNDLLVQIDLPEFQLNKLDGWTFKVKNAVFDFSDVQNASAVHFPEGYDSPYFIDGDKKLWRGFYIRDLTVKLPQEFDKKGSGGRTTISAHDMIIDNTGFSGNLEVKSLLSLKEGDANKWALSVDDLSVSFLQNKLQSGDIKGQLVVPALDKDKPLDYAGHIAPGGNYQLTATLTGDKPFNVFSAKLTLEKNSYVDLKVENGKFLPKVVLNGKLDLDAPVGGSKGPSLRGVAFQELTLQTKAPYISASYFGLASDKGEQKLSNFPITVNSLALKSEGQKVGIDADIYVNFVKSSDNGFGGGGAFTIWGEMSETGKAQSFHFKEVEVHKIVVDVDKQPGFSFHGEVNFYKGDATYGRGFRGELAAKFSSIDVKAVALFGNVDSYRYWYVDAMVKSDNGIPVMPPFVVNGLGGGAYYHMRQQGFNENVGSDLGKSNSGLIYVPDKKSFLGIKASVYFSLAKASGALNGDATFEINFNGHGGVNQIAFTGNAKFLTKKFTAALDKIKKATATVSAGKDLPPDNSASVRGSVKLLFDNTNHVFHGDLRVYVNIGGVMKGVGDNDLAGQAVIHFEPGKWYIHVGSPDNPVGIQLLGLAKTESYFMVGDEIPGSPPPPKLVRDIIGSGEDLDYMRDLNALGDGKGFAFGSRLSVDTGDMHFLIFYGRFAATAGFDIMLKKYEGVSCKGRSGPIGIDGWYANGQAYVGLMCTIGMRIKLSFIKKDVEIFHGAAAALMQAKGPNPLWMKGTVAGEFRVLNGLVSGHFKFDVTLGEECEIQQEGSPLDNIDVIAELTPSDGSKNIDVFNTPQAVFNIPVNKNFNLVDVEEKKHTYRAELEYFRLKDGSTTLPANLTFNGRNDVVGLETYDVFPSKKKLTLEVEVSFKEKENGVWKVVYNNGKKVIEDKKVTFTSGEEPDYIPKSNVAYSYPMEGMVNFYPKEYGKGYVKLKKGMRKPFENDGKWVFKASFTDKGNAHYRSSFSYDANKRQVNFSIPNLPNNKVLKFDLMRVPAGAAGAIDRNVDSTKTKAQSDVDSEVSMETRTNNAEGIISTLQEKSILSFFMRTSNYNTLKAKMSSSDYTRNIGWRYPIRPGIHELGYTMKYGPEDFGEMEISGDPSKGVAPLVSFKADFSGNKWYEEYLYPIIYQGYPLNAKAVITHRNPDSLGVPPAKAIYIRQYDPNFMVNQSSGYSQNLAMGIDPFAIIYNIADEAEIDFIKLRNKVANYYLNKSKSDRVKLLLNASFPVIRKGPYKVNVRYVLPGINKITSSYQFTIHNPVGQE